MATSRKAEEKKPKISLHDTVFDADETVILKQIYSSLKDRNSLDQHERLWIEGIENAYKAKMKTVLEQAYEILYQQTEIWTPREEELYSLLERVVFLKARENTFRDFFDTIENVIESASKLDFSKRVPLSDISTDQRNLFNYAVMCLNILVENMETAVISKTAANSIASSIPGTIIFLADNNGAIRFINDLGEKLLGLNENEYQRKSVALLIENYKQISKEYQTEGQLKDRKANLIIPGKTKQTIPVFITISKPHKENMEIEETIYFISVDASKKQTDTPESDFNLTREIHDKIAPVSTIISAANILGSRYTDEEGKMLLNSIKENAKKLKLNAMDSLNAISVSPEDMYSDVSLVTISTVITEIVDSLKLNEGFDQMTFDIDVNYKNKLVANLKLVHSIFQNLISNAIKYRSKKNPSMKISVRDLSKTELLIIVGDNGIGIKQEDQEKVFDRTFQAAVDNEGHGMGLFIVKESITRLKGTIQMDSTPGKGTEFIIRLPCGE